MLELKVTITADESALEFSRNLAGFFPGETFPTVKKAPCVETTETGTKRELIDVVKKTGKDIHEITRGVATSEQLQEKLEAIEQDHLAFEAQQAQDPEVPEEPKAEQKQYTLEECRAAAEAYLGKHGVPEFKRVIASFGVRKVTELPKDKYAEFMEKVGG